MPSTDHIATLGLLSLGSRFKRLSDALYQEMIAFYQSQGIDFDPGNFPLMHYLFTHRKADIGSTAKQLGISQAAISQKAAALAKAGLIRFTTQKNDRRKSHIELTPKGYTLIGRMQPSWDTIRHVITTQLGENAMPLLNTLENLEESIATGTLQRELQHTASKNSVKIVPFEKQYAKHFDRLNRAWIKEYFSVEPFDNEVLTNPQKMIIDNGGEVWFAALDGTIVGACALFALKPGMFEFTKLGVDKSAHRRGVARTLLKHAATRAKKRGAHTLRIFTSTKLAPANALYVSEGFKEVSMSAAEKSRYCRCDIMYDLPLAVE